MSRAVAVPPRRRRARAAFACWCVLGLASAWSCRAAVATRMPVEERVLALMECQECVNDELRSVVALGPSAVPLLRRYLVDGPPANRVQRLAAALDELAANAPQGRVPSAAARAAQLDNYRATFQRRSALALGGIGGGMARDALCDGRVAGGLRPDVRSAIDAALLKIHGTCP